MKVLMLHNYYRQAGGEDVVVAQEQRLLAAHGHDARLYAVSNDVVRSGWDQVRTAWRASYSFSSRRNIAGEITRFRPDLAHVHNFFPLLSPAVYDACRAAGVPVVQTLHNYRLLCPNALLFRDGHVCEDCLLRRVPWPGVVHACYKGSRPASGTVAAMLTVHRLLGTWTEKVDVFVALTDFARDKFVQGGIPARKIVVKPNCVYPDPGPGGGGGAYALFVGRLSPEKGLNPLIGGWRRLAGSIPLKIVGDGPLAPLVARAAETVPQVEWLGAQSAERVRVLMQGACMLIFPSLWYEPFGMVVAEAYAAGVPVVASRLGAMASMVVEGQTGLHVDPADPADLAAKVTWLWAHPRERAVMAGNARREFERKYTGARSYELLMDAYALALQRSAARRSGALHDDTRSRRGWLSSR